LRWCHGSATDAAKGLDGAAMCGALAYIARRRFQERERFETWIRSVEQGRKSEPAWGGRRKRLTCEPAASATEKEGIARAWKLGQRRLAGLGPSGRGVEERAAHVGDRQGALSGCGWAGPNPRREMKILFFFFSNFSKHFPNRF
jgi:hypothetical protein